jgi:hypothetical protein
MDDRDRELETTVEDLAETLEDLRAELREPPRGPLGLPRPPTPGEFLRFTERYTIPALISLLEASIRTLELLAAALRVADGRPLDGDPSVRREVTAAGTDRLAAASRRTLSTLDDALAELQSAATGGEPESPELQRLLSEARQLRAEVDDRLAEATTAETGRASDPEPVNIEVTGGGDAESPDDRDRPPGDEAGVDVDSELETIKREFEEDRADEDDEADRDSRQSDGSERSDGEDGTDGDRQGGDSVDDTDFGGDR